MSKKKKVKHGNGRSKADIKKLGSMSLFMISRLALGEDCESVGIYERFYKRQKNNAKK